MQEMLAGEPKLIGNGNIRDVYLVEREGRTLVVKALRGDYELRATKRRADKIHRWEAAALDAVSNTDTRNPLHNTHPSVVPRFFVCEDAAGGMVHQCTIRSSSTDDVK